MGILVCFLLFEIQKMVSVSEWPLLGGQFSDIVGFEDYFDFLLFKIPKMVLESEWPHFGGQFLTFWI